MTFPLFLSCWKWDRKAEEWIETGASVNIALVEWFEVGHVDGGENQSIFPESWSIVCHANRDRVRLVAGAPTREVACGFASTLLSASGIPHWPPLPPADLEVERKPGVLGDGPSSN